ncbi:DUF1573 domain-containing protein [Chitinophagaceae bacterium MMS25-I14]
MKHSVYTTILFILLLQCTAQAQQFSFTGGRMMYAGLIKAGEERHSSFSLQNTGRQLLQIDSFRNMDENYPGVARTLQVKIQPAHARIKPGATARFELIWSVSGTTGGFNAGILPVLHLLQNHHGDYYADTNVLNITAYLVPDTTGDVPVMFFPRGTLFDLGLIPEGHSQTVFYRFINKGTKPVIIYNVQSPCGCLTPEYGKDSVLPGKTGFVKLTYVTQGRPGFFDKTVNVFSNDAYAPATTPPPTTVTAIRLKGFVKPVADNPEKENDHK